MKNMMKPILVIVVAALVLFGFKVGFSKIAKTNAEKELNTMLETLLPGSTSFEMEEVTGDNAEVQAAYKGETGYVIQTATYGYAGDIVMMVGVSNDGTVTGLVVRDLSETFGLGANALTDTAFLAQYLETAGDAEIGTNVDAMTGATISSKALISAVNAAIDGFNAIP